MPGDMNESELISAMTANDPSVRLAAILAIPIARERGDFFLPALHEMLRDSDPTIRLAAAEACLKVDRNDSIAIESLALELKTNCSVLVRENAVEDLTRYPLPSEAVARALAIGLADVSGSVRAMAVFDMKKMGKHAREFAGSVMAMLSDETDPITRGHAAWTLAAIAGATPQTVAALRRALTDVDAEVRESAAGALGKLGPEAVEACNDLLRCLDDPNYEVRMRAANALGDIQCRRDEVLAALIWKLADKHGAVVVAAAGAIRYFGRDAWPAVAALQKSAETSDGPVRLALTDALDDITRHRP
jgi:HEAT repeat protein